ncbi:MAG: uroporphyrinogen decarboxylase family protein [Candidatus Fervidibacter sp.]|uniref:uroporphyrinogen decarboxylase family protein n=1 Tax=Candidatus Fervidibacter sp. TaxID=3100871 RepID=UPI00404AC7AE
MWRHVPLKRPKPNAQEFVDTLMGRVPQFRTPLVEYIVDDFVMRPIVTDLLGREWVTPTGDRESLKAYLDNLIEFWYRMGYDFVRLEIGLPFHEKRLFAPDPASNKQRAWVDEHQGAISNWDDFERYPWPRVEGLDFFPLEYINEHLPEGMGLISSHGGGIFEHLSWLMSLEGLSFSLYDDPKLVQAVSNRIGELITKFYEHLLQLENLIIVFPGDDMGFRSGTLVSPDALRNYCLPWHKRWAEMAHERGLPYFLHSCGNVLAIMDDLISDVGIDGKHSFEDAIITAEEFQKLYGNKIAVLGGVDLNILGAGTPEQVQRRTRQLIETCGAKGRFAVGSGNSIPTYVPVENYLAMVDEALDYMFS